MKIIISTMFGIIGYLAIPVFWHFSKDYDKLLSFSSLMIFGSLIGLVLI